IRNKIGASVDADANYVYFYQLVNWDPIPSDSDHALSFFQVVLPAGTGVVTSAGYVTHFVFNEIDDGTNGGVPVGDTYTHQSESVLNTALGSDTTADDEVNGTPSLSGLSWANGREEFATLSGGPPVDPFGVAFNSSGGDAVIRWSLSLPSNQTSSILYFTSNSIPGYARGETMDGTWPISSGDVPSVVPEPSTLAMMLSALPLLGIALLRRRRKT
ncbi:MAG TPA: PEP-CTERM sorting domain-containing protein, partial [Planctomycetaceae bacterium]|nr:PEP-CTERM sorting domain-containing protein [Planctomycetaceae bacterium]